MQEADTVRLWIYEPQHCMKDLDYQFNYKSLKKLFINIYLLCHVNFKLANI